MKPGIGIAALFIYRLYKTISFDHRKPRYDPKSDFKKNLVTPRFSNHLPSQFRQAQDEKTTQYLFENTRSDWYNAVSHWRSSLICHFSSFVTNCYKKNIQARIFTLKHNIAWIYQTEKIRARKGHSWMKFTTHHERKQKAITALDT